MRGGRRFWPLILLAAALLTCAPLLGGRPVDYAAAILGYLAGVVVCVVCWRSG